MDWILLLIKLKHPELSKSLEEHKIPQTLLSIMQTYYMHSILHIQIYQIFQEAFKSGSDEMIKTVRNLFIQRDLVFNQV